MSRDEFVNFCTKGKNKYHNIPTVVDGIRFQSKKEAEKYKELKILQANGEISYFLRQVPIDLPGDIKYKVDFLVVKDEKAAYSTSASSHLTYIDVKGYKTREYILKKKQVEALYPIRIVEI
jgi:hypothetical protein